MEIHEAPFCQSVADIYWEASTVFVSFNPESRHQNVGLNGIESICEIIYTTQKKFCITYVLSGNTILRFYLSRPKIKFESFILFL